MLGRVGVFGANGTRYTGAVLVRQHHPRAINPVCVWVGMHPVRKWSRVLETTREHECESGRDTSTKLLGRSQNLPHSKPRHTLPLALYLLVTVSI